MSSFKFVTFNLISMNKFIGIVTNYVFLTVKSQQVFVFSFVIFVQDYSSTEGFV